MRRWYTSIAVVITLVTTGCGGFGLSCRDEDGPVMSTNGVVAAGGIATISVRSPKSSNLIVRLRWDEREPRLDLRATITNCGGHTGCAMLTSTPAFGPGGPSPVPQPWPAGYVEMLVDGWVGKTYLLEVVGVADRDVPYHLEVMYHIRCES